MKARGATDNSNNNANNTTSSSTTTHAVSAMERFKALAERGVVGGSFTIQQQQQGDTWLAGAAAGSTVAHQRVPQRYRGVYVYRLPYPPPSRDVICQWVAYQQQKSKRTAAATPGAATAAASAAGGAGGGAGGAGGTRPRDSDSFVMDANTGKFIPTTPLTAGVKIAGAAAGGGGGSYRGAMGPRTAGGGGGGGAAAAVGAPGPDLDLSCTPALLLSDPSQLLQEEREEGGAGGMDTTTQQGMLSAVFVAKVVSWFMQGQLLCLIGHSPLLFCLETLDLNCKQSGIWFQLCCTVYIMLRG